MAPHSGHLYLHVWISTILAPQTQCSVGKASAGDVGGFSGFGLESVLWPEARAVPNPLSEEGERQPRLARRSPLTARRKYCPKCLGPMKAGGGLGGWLLPQEYVCTACGYRGTVYLEKDTEAEPKGGEKP